MNYLMFSMTDLRKQVAYGQCTCINLFCKESPSYFLLVFFILQLASLKELWGVRITAGAIRWLLYSAKNVEQSSGRGQDSDSRSSKDLTYRAWSKALWDVPKEVTLYFLSTAEGCACSPEGCKTCPRKVRSVGLIKSNQASQADEYCGCCFMLSGSLHEEKR